jgi:mxaJ protein
MSGRSARALAALLFAAGAAPGHAGPPAATAAPILAPAGVLRVCADPNNLPFSHRAGTGLENRLAELLARRTGRRLRYHWTAQRRGFLRNSLLAGACDVVPGIASHLPMLATTRPYYRSSYVFVAPARLRPALESFDDPRLRQMKLGVQLIGDDGANTPPAHALSRRGLSANLRGYSVFGDYRDPAPQRAIVAAVAAGEVDAAAVWGPVAGYFAALQPRRLALRPVRPWLDGPQWPMLYDVSLGLRREDRALRRELDQALLDERSAIDALLREFHVPRLDGEAPAAAP